ncbi:MAG: hypothetical protein JST40_12295 [Armatimonadetes bacterium]|nr:hypothetical protein [Armatimonadota bacterium]
MAGVDVNQLILDKGLDYWHELFRRARVATIWYTLPSFVFFKPWLAYIVDREGFQNNRVFVAPLAGTAVVYLYFTIVTLPLCKVSGYPRWLHLIGAILALFLGHPSIVVAAIMWGVLISFSKSVNDAFEPFAGEDIAIKLAFHGKHHVDLGPIRAATRFRYYHELAKRDGQDFAVHPSRIMILWDAVTRLTPQDRFLKRWRAAEPPS